MNRVSYLGPSGTYAEQAALTFFKEPIRGVPHPSIQGTLRALAEGDVDFAVVPVENAIEGSVGATLDALWRLPGLQVVCALVLPIRHCLVSHEPALAAIRAVYSHPQALGQCQGWLEEHLSTAERIPCASTADALDRLGPGTAAITSERAAGLRGLPLLATAIQDHSENCTRFWLVGEAGRPAPSDQKPPQCTSIAFSLRQNRPGALYEALAIFAHRQINLARIESRPTRKVIGEYLYFADIEGPADREPVCNALSELAALVADLKIFGSYPIRQAPQA